MAVALFMVIGMIPFNALAEETPAPESEPTIIETGTAVAKVGDTEYETLNEAFLNAFSGTANTTITLLQNAEFSLTVNQQMGNGAAMFTVTNVTLDLNGYDVTVKTNMNIMYGDSLTITGNGNMTFVENGNITVMHSDGMATNSALVIENGTFVNETAGNAIIVSKDASATIADGTFEGSNIIASSYSSSTITINGGNFSQATLNIKNSPTVNKAETVEISAPSGYTWDENGALIEAPAYVASVNGTGYATLAEAIAAAKDGEAVVILAGELDLDGATIPVDTNITIKGSGNLETVLTDVIFDVDSASETHQMNVVFDNIKFLGTSRIIVGSRSHHNGVGGPDALPTTGLTVTNCYAETTFASDSLAGGKGQFIYLAATYSVKLDLTLTGNTFINAHTIAGEDASPVVNGNGTVINNVTVTGNTFGSEANPCERYALKFARRANGATVTIANNTVYGATTADKDFYILDLWQSGSNKQDGLTVAVDANTVNCTPNEGRTVYAAYIEGTVNGSTLNITAADNKANGETIDILDKSVDDATVAKVGDKSYASLADAIAAANEGDTILVLASEIELPIITKAGLIFKTEVGTKITNVIDKTNSDNGWHIDGTTFDGFEFTKRIGLIGKDLTLKNCKFTGGYGVYYGVCSGTWAIDNCVFNNSVYGLQIGEGSGKVNVTNTTFVGGFNTFGSGFELVFDGCTFNKGTSYNIVQTHGNMTIKNSTIAADWPTGAQGGTFGSVAATAVTEIYNTTYAGEGSILDLSENKAVGVMVLDPVKDADGKYTAGTFAAEPDASLLADGFVIQKNADGSFGIAKPSSIGAYISEENGVVKFWGEFQNAAVADGIALQILDANGNLMATIGLNDPNHTLDAYTSLSWWAPVLPGQTGDDYWPITWEAGYPKANVPAAKAVLLVGGEKAAETSIGYAGADNLRPAVAWKGIFEPKFVTVTIDGVTSEVTYLSDALAAASTATGDVVITLTKDAKLAYWESVNFDCSVNLTLDGAGHTISNLNAPLFSMINAGGTETTVIKNMTIADPAVQGVVAQGTNNGAALIGWYEGHMDGDVLTIENVHISGGSINADYYAGGLVAYISSTGTVTINGCSVSNVAITSRGSSVGSLVGHADKLTVVDSTISGNTVNCTDNAKKQGAVIGTANGNVSIDVTEETASTSSNPLTVIGRTYKNVEIADGSYFSDPTVGSDSDAETNVTVDGAILQKDGKYVVAKAKIGQTLYPTIQDAIDDAEAGQTVTVIGNSRVDAEDGKPETHIWVKADDDVIIDLNGKTVTGAFFINGTATIQNGSIVNTSIVSGIESQGNLTLENMTVISNRHALRISGGTTTILSGTYQTNGSGGTHHTVNASGANTVLVIKDGTFIGAGEAGNGSKGNCVMDQGVKSATIEGGTFYGANGVEGPICPASNTVISGGTFADTTATWRYTASTAEGYVGAATGNGWYEVVEATVQNSTTGAFYGSLQAAIDAAKNGDIIALLADIQLSETVKFNGGIGYTLDLNGKALTIDSDTTDGIVVTNGSALILKNGTYNFDCASSSYDAVYVANGTLNVEEGVTMNVSSTANSAFHGEQNAVINIKGGKITMAGEASSSVGAIQLTGNATLNMTGGEFSIDIHFDGNYDPWNRDAVGVVILGNNNEANLTGGSFNVNGVNAFAQGVQIATMNGYAKDSKFVINGTQFSVNNEGTGECVPFAVFDPSQGSFEVKSGSVTGNFTSMVSQAYSGTPDIQISGGTFSIDPSEYVTEDFAAIKQADGTYDVLKKSGNSAYVSNNKGTVTIWGETTNADPESDLHIDIVDASGIVMGTVKLNNVGGIYEATTSSLTWHMMVLGEEYDTYWSTSWNEGYPNPDVQPAEALLYIDGNLVNSCTIAMSAPDGLNPVVWKQLFVAQVNGTCYGSIQAAIDAANGAEITLLTDTTEDVNTDKDFVLDLNGKTVHGYFFLSGTATLKNGTIDSTSTKNKAGIEVSKNCVLTTDKLTVLSNRHAIRVDGGELTVNSGTYTTIGNAGSADTCHALNAGGGDYSYAKVTINGGIFNGLGAAETVENADSGAAITAQVGAEITIYDGEFYGKYRETVANNYGGTYLLVGGIYDQDPRVTGASLPQGYVAVEDNGLWHVVLLTNWIQVADTSWYEGEGVYTISTPEQLAGIAKLVNNGTTLAGVTITLDRDIDLSGASYGRTNVVWPSIGVYSQSSNAQAFQGIFDGAGHTISNVILADNSAGVTASEANNYRAFFNQLYNATVKNLTVQGNVWSTAPASTEYGGALIAGYANTSTIENCVAVGTVNATHNAAGIVVRMQDAKVIGCTNKADLTGSYTKMGGIAALSQQGSTGSLIDGCVNEGTITSTARGEDGIGGIIGWAGYPDAIITVTNCENKGNITATETATIGQIAAESWSHRNVFAGNKGLTTMLATGHSAMDGLNFATVSGNIATYTATIEAGNTYLVTGPTPKPVIKLAPGESITFDLSLGQIDASGITSTTGIIITENGNLVTYSAAVAQINDEKFATLQDAVEAAQADDEIIVLADITESGITVATDDSVIIDLNGKTVTGNFVVYGNATISKGTIDSTVSGKSGIEVNNEANRSLNPTLTVEDLVIVSGRHAIRVDGGTVIINSGSYTAADAASNHAVNISDGGNVIIKDGTFVGNMQSGTGAVAIRGSESQLTIEGGTFTGGSQGSLTVWAGSASVTGGTFESVYGDVAIAISGGTFEKVNKLTGNAVTGGTFGADVTDYCIYGKVAQLQSDGYYHIVDATVKNATTGKLYATLSDALADANAGDEITLLADIVLDPIDGTSGKLTHLVTIDKNITLDLNGKTISLAPKASVTGMPCILTITNGAEVIITGEGVINSELGTNAVYAIDVMDGKLTIESGVFTGGATVAQVVKGELVINGGKFDMTDTYSKNYAQYYTYLFNCIDANYKDGSAKITVNGGLFVGFNPSCNSAEGKHTNFVKDGYIAVEADGVYSIVEGDNYVGVYTKPTFDADGFTTYTCQVCGDSYIVVDEGSKLIPGAQNTTTGELYVDLFDALADANEGDTITMLADETLKYQINHRYVDNVTIDLNGHTLTDNASGDRLLINGVTTTIQNGKIVSNNPGGQALYIYGNADVTLKNVQISGDSKYGQVYLKGNAKLTVDADSSITSTGATQAINVVGNNTVNVNGTVTANGTAIATSYDSTATVSISDGAVVSGEIAVYVNGGVANITGGTVTGKLQEIKDNGIIVSGGTFSEPVDEKFCAEGYIPADNGDGTYGVKQGEYVASITDAQGNVTKFEALAEALSAAKAGDLVTVLKDIDNAGIMIIPADVTLHIGDHTVKADYVIGLNGSKLAATPAEAKLIVPVKNVALSKVAYVDEQGYDILPVYDPAGYFQFSRFEVNTDPAKDRGLYTDEDTIEFQFVVNTTGDIKRQLLANGVSDNELSVVIRLEWKTENGTAYQDFVYNDNFCSAVFNGQRDYDFTFTLENYSALGIDLSTLTVKGMVLTNCGVVSAGIEHSKN